MTRKCSGFVIYSYFEDSAVTAVKRDAWFLTRHVIRVPFCRWKVFKMGTFPVKNGI